MLNICCVFIIMMTNLFKNIIIGSRGRNIPEISFFLYRFLKQTFEVYKLFGEPMEAHVHFA